MRVRTLQRKLGKSFHVQRGDKRGIEVLTRDGNRPVEFKPDGSWRDEAACADYIKSRMPCMLAAPPPPQ